MQLEWITVLPSLASLFFILVLCIPLSNSFMLSKDILCFTLYWYVNIKLILYPFSSKTMLVYAFNSDLKIYGMYDWSFKFCLWVLLVYFTSWLDFSAFVTHLPENGSERDDATLKKKQIIAISAAICCPCWYCTILNTKLQLNTKLHV